MHCQVDRIARVAFETARKRRGKLCSVDKANVLEVCMFSQISSYRTCFSLTLNILVLDPAEVILLAFISVTLVCYRMVRPENIVHHLAMYSVISKVLCSDGFLLD